MRKQKVHIKKAYHYPGMFIEKSQPKEMEEIERRPELFANARMLVRA